MDFSRKHNLIKSAEEAVISLQKKNILKELNNIKKTVAEEINKNKTFNLSEENLNELFKIAIKYETEMLKLKKDEVEVEFDYLYLGPEFLVSSTQPALGMVYKIMQMNNLPCIKFSEEKDKQTIPGSKSIYRLYDYENNLVGDYLVLVNENDEFIDKKNLKAL